MSPTRKLEMSPSANVWLPPSHAADFQLAAEKIRKDPDLALGPMRRISTGKLEKLQT